MLNIILYTDGSHSSKTNRGGWAVVRNKNIFLYGSAENTTNNRMELTAVLEALKACYNLGVFSDFPACAIYTDSAYISNCFKEKWYETWRKNGWKTSGRKPVANRDLWEEILGLYDVLFPAVQILKVEGHAGVELNEYADTIAVMAREGKI